VREFEAGVSAISIMAPYEMTRHGHRWLDRVSQVIDVRFVSSTVANNYNCETTPSVLPGVTV
jgi:hypothetical protein